MAGNSSIGNDGTTDDNEAHSKAEGLGGKTFGEKTVGNKPRDPSQDAKAKPPRDKAADATFDETNIE